MESSVSPSRKRSTPSGSQYRPRSRTEVDLDAEVDLQCVMQLLEDHDYEDEALFSDMLAETPEVPHARWFEHYNNSCLLNSEQLSNTLLGCVVSKP